MLCLCCHRVILHVPRHACLTYSSFAFVSNPIQRINELAKTHGNVDGAYDRRQIDEKLVIAYSLYEVAHLLSCTFFSLQQRDPSQPIDNDLVSRDISAALSAFADSKKMFQEMDISHIDENDAQEHVSDPSLARAKHVPQIIEEMIQTMAILYREMSLLRFQLTR